MTGDCDHETITVGETADGQPYTLPLEEILTGRAFITGKSGAGKSNTGSVIAEELLERGHPFLIVDVDGEYWGLKEEYEILHVGATEECELPVGPEHAGKLAELALDRHVPIILDVSGYVDGDRADELVRETVRELFVREQDALLPFLLLVEEIHEYIPQSGSPGEVGEMLVKVAKRGRKRGLGIAGLSQRPADVQKDFITQADLLVWHRLTWDNDTDVVKRVAGSDAADKVGDLGDGEAFVQADWAEADVERVQFRRKHTFDAGATPGLDDVEQPELKSIGDDLADELDAISDEHDRRQDRIADLEAQLDARDEEIADLEAEIERLKTADETLDLLTQRLQGGGDDGGDVSAEMQERLEAKNETIAELRERVDELEDTVADLREERDALADDVDRLRGFEERVERAERIEEQLEQARDVLGVEVSEAPAQAADDDVDALRDRIDELEAENERLRERDGVEISETIDAYEDFLDLDAVQEQIEAAKAEAAASERYVKGVLAAIISESGPVSYEQIADRLNVSTTTDVSKAASELERRQIVTKDRTDQGMTVDLNVDGIEDVHRAAAEREKTEQIMEDL